MACANIVSGMVAEFTSGMTLRIRVGRGVGLGVGRGVGLGVGRGVGLGVGRSLGSGVGRYVGNRVGRSIGMGRAATHCLARHLYPRVLQSMSEQQKLFLLPFLAQIEHRLFVHSLTVLQILLCLMSS